jgi:putative flippase GtrA
MMGMTKQIFRFGMIGGLGFLVDAGVLSLLIQKAGWDLYSSRALSFSLAVTATWYLNRQYTFIAGSAKGKAKEYGRYVSGQIVGGLINLAVYAGVLSIQPALAVYPVIPLAFGSAVALMFNFLYSKFIAFKSPVDNGSAVGYLQEHL